MLTLIITAVLPVLLFLYLVYIKDTVKEPKGILIKSFFGGFLSIILVFATAIPISILSGYIHDPLLKSIYDAFLSAAIPEEMAKFLILFWIVWRNKHFDQYYDGIVYAVFVSLGFALVENIMYVVNGGLFVALSRGILSIPGHGFFGVIMGYYLSLAKFKIGKQRKVFFLKSMFLPVLFHGLFDFLLMYLSYKERNDLFDIFLMMAFLIIVIVLWILGIKDIKRHARKDKAAIEPHNMDQK